VANGTFKPDINKIAMEKINVSFAEEARKDLDSAQDAMHTAFKQKIK
jgi:hypothetical protein